MLAGRTSSTATASNVHLSTPVTQKNEGQLITFVLMFGIGSKIIMWVCCFVRFPSV